MSHLQVLISRNIVHIVLQFYVLVELLQNTKKTVRQKNCKTICKIILKINTWRWLIRVETCSQNNYICYIEVKQIYHNIVVSTEIYCRFTINRLSYHATGWILLDFRISSEMTRFKRKKSLLNTKNVCFDFLYNVCLKHFSL